MNPRTASLAVGTLALAAAVLSGCSSDDAAGAEHDEQGQDVPAGVAEQYGVLAEEIAEKGQTVETGEWTVNLIAEAAEPWHAMHADGRTTYREPAAGETNHLEIVPVEKASGRIVPDVPITLAVLDPAGDVVQELDLKFYYSTFFHYANNFSIPEAGSYTLRVTLGAPAFNRHGDADEVPALAEGATVEFDDVELGPQ